MCACVPGEVLRPYSAANPADICVPPSVVYKKVCSYTVLCGDRVDTRNGVCLIS